MNPTPRSDEPDGPTGSDDSDDELREAAASAEGDPSAGDSGGADVDPDAGSFGDPDEIDEELQSLINATEADSASQPNDDEVVDAEIVDDEE